MEARRGLAVVAVGMGLVVLAACGGGYGGSSGGYGGGGGGSYSSSSSSMASSVYSATAVVSDQAGAAAHTDAHLVNGWGVAFNPVGYVWVANNGTDTSTLYDGNGVVQSLVVAMPAGTDVTGIVYNDGTGFSLTAGGVTGTSNFIFTGEGGTLVAWSAAVDLNNGHKVYDGSAGGAVYKGLAVLTGATNRLYAADFHNKRIDVFDTGFNKIAVTGTFSDAAIPADYAPFNVQAIGDQLYVAYAKTTAGSDDETAGAGFGYVDVFDMNGNLVKHLIGGGSLNAPWGMAMAPADFGVFSNDLLVGNFGDGKINVYNPTTGAMVGTISKADGTAIVVDGLWGMAFGNGINAQPTNTLFYAAGPNDEAHGAYGRIDLK